VRPAVITCSAPLSQIVALIVVKGVNRYNRQSALIGALPDKTAHPLRGPATVICQACLRYERCLEYFSLHRPLAAAIALLL
jgi:hypothetical protein